MSTSRTPTARAAPAQHGGMTPARARQLGLDPHAVLDLSTSLNPCQTPAGVRRAVAQADIHSYPDPANLAGREGLARLCGLTTGRIVIGNGASELIWSLVQLHAQTSDAQRPVLIVEPAFGQVYAACSGLGVPCAQTPATSDREGAPELNLDTAARFAKRQPCSCIYLCNPLTPTGKAVPLDALRDFVTRVAPTPVLLDESFLALSDAHAQLDAELPEHVVRVRSLTKDFRIPGVRIGYAIVPEGTPAKVQALRPAWTVSAAAEAVAVQSRLEGAHLIQSRAVVTSLRAALVRGLSGLGLAPFASAAPYLAFAYPDASRLTERLLREQGIAVRDCTSFGLSGVVRVGLPVEPERIRLLSGLSAVMEKQG